MSDYSSKTSWEPPARDKRKADQDPARVPPHKKPRKYRLTVKYVRTINETCEKEFVSKAAMQEFRGRVERAIAKRKEEPPGRSQRWFGHWYGVNSDLKMESMEYSHFKTGPEFTEEMIDG